MYPLELSGTGAAGWVPFIRHPLYALLLAGADRVAGVPAMVLLSAAGTVAAAAIAALLARRLDAAVARPTFWAVGVASPLFFDGYLVIAHSLGAAAAGLAALGAFAFLDRRRWPALIGAAAAITVAVLLRSEAALFAGALAAVVAVAGWRRHRISALVAGGLLAGVAAVTHVAETAWQAAIVGEGGASAGLPAASGSRIAGFVATWLSPGDRPRRVGEVLLIVMLVVTVAAAVELRRGQARLAAALLTAAFLLAVARLAVAPAEVIPGLLIAFPLMVVGLLSADRLEPLGATAVLFALGVLATQYDRGGTTEWGGRYFALTLPLAVPVLIVSVRSRLPAIDDRDRRAIVTALTLQAAAMAILAVASLRVGHQRTADLVAAAKRAPSTANAVVLTSRGAVPRLAWSLLDRQRWLLAARCRCAGVGDAPPQRGHHRSHGGRPNQR